jgi:hypothetical protein
MDNHIISSYKSDFKKEEFIIKIKTLFPAHIEKTLNLLSLCRYLHAYEYRHTERL